MMSQPPTAANPQLAIDADNQQLSSARKSGFHSALSLLLNADDAGVHAWIVAAEQQHQDGSSPSSGGGRPPVRQKNTVLLNEVFLSQHYRGLYQKAMNVEAEATWGYLDQLACRACELAKMKKDERRQRARTEHIAGARRVVEEHEFSVRQTLEEHHLQSLRLLGRDLMAKRSLLSKDEFKAQASRVARRVADLVADAQEQALMLDRAVKVKR